VYSPTTLLTTLLSLLILTNCAAIPAAAAAADEPISIYRPGVNTTLTTRDYIRGGVHICTIDPVQNHYQLATFYHQGEGGIELYAFDRSGVIISFNPYVPYAEMEGDNNFGFDSQLPYVLVVHAGKHTLFFTLVALS
jgi:hypothetical protein